MIKYVYTVFLGLLIAIFVGVGISVFYPQPTMPKYPVELEYSYSMEKERTAEQIEIQKQYDADTQAWNEKMETYNRNVSTVALVFSVALVVISFFLVNKSVVIANGVMLGGVFTLVYSLIRGFMSMNTKYSFVVVTVALIIAIVLGYTRFVVPHEAKTKKT